MLRFSYAALDRAALAQGYGAVTSGRMPYPGPALSQLTHSRPAVGLRSDRRQWDSLEAAVGGLARMLSCTVCLVQ